MHKHLNTKMNAHLRDQWSQNKDTALQRCGKKGYGQMSHPSPSSRQVLVHVWRPPRERHGLGPFVPLQARVTANKYKVVLSDSMSKHFYPDGADLFQDDNAPHPQDTRGH